MSQKNEMAFKLKHVAAFTLVGFLGLLYVYTQRNYTSRCDFMIEPNAVNEQRLISQKIKLKAKSLKQFCQANGYNEEFGFIADFSIASNKYRFFVYDFEKDSIVAKGLVAHGSCKTNFLKDAKFKNEMGCACSSKGRYKVGYTYTGKFGKAYKLYGLDSSNSLAFERNIVLHGYADVPNTETQEPLCNSLGCPMVSHDFLDKLGKRINTATKPIILWIVE